MTEKKSKVAMYAKYGAKEIISLAEHLDPEVRTPKQLAELLEDIVEAATRIKGAILEHEGEAGSDSE